MKLSLKYRLIASYVVISLVAVVSLLVTSKLLVTDQFDAYIANNMEQRMILLSTQINLDLNRSETSYDAVDWQDYSTRAMDDGFLLSIVSNQGDSIWCTECALPGMTTTMLQEISEQMEDYNAKLSPELMSHSFDLIQKNQIVGTMVIEHFAPFYYSLSELAFLRTLDLVFLVAASLFFVVAVAFGIVMASRIASPLHHMEEQTKRIELGHYDEQIHLNTNTKEIVALGNSINGLAATLNRQLLIRKKLAQNYAHEFRTPLAVLRSSIEGMIDGIWEVNEVRLQSLQEEILRLSRMVEDIDQLVAVEEQGFLLQCTSFDLFYLIQSICSNFEGELLQKDIALSVTGESTLIVGDKDRLGQVLVNLLSNAIKYNKQHGTISVSLLDREEEVEFRISDTGDGIAKEDIPLIFEHLYRADQARGYVTRGNGIGLSIVKSIVLAHRGAISVTSELGQGSTFVVTLPKKR